MVAVRDSESPSVKSKRSYRSRRNWTWKRRSELRLLIGFVCDGRVWAVRVLLKSVTWAVRVSRFGLHRRAVTVVSVRFCGPER